jgi:hypothetical protein
MKSMNLLAVVLSLALVAATSACNGSDKDSSPSNGRKGKIGENIGGNNARDAVNADGTCGQGLAKDMTDFRNQFQTAFGSQALDQLKSARATAVGLKAKYAGVHCVAQDEQGNKQTLDIAAEFQEAINAIDAAIAQLERGDS